MVQIDQPAQCLHDSRPNRIFAALVPEHSRINGGNELEKMSDIGIVPNQVVGFDQAGMTEIGKKAELVDQRLGFNLAAPHLQGGDSSGPSIPDAIQFPFGPLPKGLPIHESAGEAGLFLQFHDQ
jgi:hypothetical protein